MIILWEFMTDAQSNCRHIPVFHTRPSPQFSRHFDSLARLSAFEVFPEILLIFPKWSPRVLFGITFPTIRIKTRAILFHCKVNMVAEHLPNNTPASDTRRILRHAGLSA